MSINAKKIIFMTHKRLCNQASPETKAVMRQIVNEVIKTNPEFKDYLVPLCEYRGSLCTEFHPCGYNKQRKEGLNED